MYSKKSILTFVFACILIFSVFTLPAKTEKIKVKNDIVELSFDRIKIHKIEFHDENHIAVKYKKNDPIKIENDEGFLSVSSSDKAKISLTLPRSKNYYFSTSNCADSCFFNENQVTIKSQDGDNIQFENDGLKITNNDGITVVEINEEGIFINEDDEKVEISSKGIIVEDEEETENLTGFWGRMLGKMIRSIASSSIKLAGKSPENIVKHIVNEQGIHLSSSSFDVNLDSNKISKQIEETFKGKKDLIVHLDNRNGNVQICSWEKDFVNVTATLKTSKDESYFDKVNVNVIGSKSGDVCTILTKYSEKKPTCCRRLFY